MEEEKEVLDDANVDIVTVSVSRPSKRRSVIYTLCTCLILCSV